MKKLLRNSGIVLVSIILIVIIKIFVHYFIFPNIGASFNTEGIEGNVYDKISNPDYKKYSPIGIECDEDYFNKKCRLIKQNISYSVPTKEVIRFLQANYRSFHTCNRNIIELEGLDDIRNWKPDIYFFYSSFSEHVSHALDFDTPNYPFEISDINNGIYVTNSGDIEASFNPNSKLYLFIIPIYILFYWLVSKYYFRKE